MTSAGMRETIWMTHRCRSIAGPVSIIPWPGHYIRKSRPSLVLRRLSQVCGWFRGYGRKVECAAPWLVLPLLAAGCTVGPDYHGPETPVPASWAETADTITAARHTMQATDRSSFTPLFGRER